VTILDAPNLGHAIAESCRTHGDRVAVLTPAATLTYRDLAIRVEAVAATLRPHIAAGPTTATGAPVVAVALDRSAEFVTAVLAVLAAGAAYLPLDLSAPDRYLRAILTDAAPAAVITAPAHTGRLTALTAATVVPAPPLNHPPGDRPTSSQSAPASAAPEDPAYVIYTSGTTGTPKGVVMPHRAMLASTAARTSLYGPPTRVPLLHSPAFDLTSGLLFWTLLTGGALVVDPVELVDVAGTLAVVRDYQVSHLIYPASLYGPFLDHAATAPPTGLLAVGIGSERWSPVLIDRHAALLPGASLVNEYGPTEACVCSSYARVYDPTTRQVAPLTIGRPIPRTGYHLLDPDGNPADDTRRGELAITGPALALGYLNRPGLTAARFITLPGGERAYRTGDLAEQVDTGEYVFGGRADRQVQVGGHRVEPGHIETVLMTHPDVAGAHVLGRGGGGGPSSTLVAYLVPRTSADTPPGGDQAGGSLGSGARPGRDGLAGRARVHLGERLPEYLIPTAFVVLDTFPRTTAGKIDAARLPTPDTADTGHGPAPASAADTVERALAAAAADILGVPAVTTTASLLDLHADSLAFVRLAARIHSEHGVDVPISALFADPSIASIATLIRDGAATDRPPLLARADPATGPAGEPVGWPLSEQQRQVWVLGHLAPDALAYQTQFTLRLHGPLNVAALQRALSVVVGRHEILRTTFHDRPDGPVQVVHPPWEARVDLVDLADLDETEQTASLAAIRRAAIRRAFDVAALPLVRWHLFRLSPVSWELLHVEHHFAHDGWSAQLFLTELRDAYHAALAGAPATAGLPELPVQYRDYAAWQHQWRRSADFAAQLDYWTGQLSGHPADAVTFAPDRPRPSRQGFRGGCLRGEIPASTVERLDALAGRCGVSRFAVFLSAFAAQVWRHTGRTDLVLGSALSNRRQPETAHLLGMFVNALPLRLAVDPDGATADLLRATMRTLLGAQDHQELPLLDLLAGIHRPEDGADSPLFRLMFAFHDSPRPSFQIGDLAGEVVIEHNGSAKGDLNIICVPNPPPPDGGGTGGWRGGVSVLWEYDSDLFDPDTAQTLLDGFLHILTVLPDTADAPLRAADLLGPQQVETILSAGTGPRLDPPYATLHAGVDAAVAADPRAVAVEHAGRRWTYTELDARASNLHRQLRAYGAGPGSVVAVICPPAAEIVAALLAVCRSGAAYVYLDPGQPPARLAALLADAAPVAVVTAGQPPAGLNLADLPVIRADSPVAVPATVPPAAAPATAEDAAYLVYTSGSTGTPKAVVATHRNAVTAVHARTVHFGPDEPPRTLVTLPPIFDVAPSMMFWTLWHAGTIVLPDEPADAVDPDRIRGLVRAHRVSHVNFVASFYQQFLATVGTDGVGRDVGWAATLAAVAIGGEPCRPDLVAAHAAALPEVALHNEYGPTEATVWCSAAQVYPAASEDDGRVTIGRPLANATLEVLTSGGDLAPIGAAGELHVGGDGVVASYYQRPDLTAQRFITPPGGALAGRRFYRTGDLARLRPDGTFEILGRLDEQVKVRGHRVELGEVRSCLLDHPQVTDAAVLLDPAPPGGRLVAYLTGNQPASQADAGSPDAAGGELGERARAWVAGRLPAYMAPAAYVVLDGLPRTPTGKIDRDRLPEPTHTATPAALPRSAREERLLAVWREILAAPGLGVEDDFITAGGDSLQAIRVAARARDLGVPVSAAQVLDARTVRALDSILPPEPATADRPHSPHGRTAARRPAGTRLALTPIQHWFFGQHFADPDHFHQARLFDLDSNTDTSALRAALVWTTARHDAFRTRFDRDRDGSPTATLTGGPPPGTIAERTIPPRPAQSLPSRLAGELDGVHRELSIASGQLARFVLLTDTDTGQRWLYALLHHLIVDTVSWDILTRDIHSTYTRLRAGEDLPVSPAPGVPTSPGRSPLATNRPDAAPDTKAADLDGMDAGYWRWLAGAPTPQLGNGKPTSTPIAARLQAEAVLSAHATGYLRRDAMRLHRAGTLAMLLAALGRAVQPLSDQPGLYTWLEGHGRGTRPGGPHSGAGPGVDGDLGDVVGWLTALYPALLLPTNHAGDRRVQRLVDQAAAVEEQLAAIPDGGTGHGQIRYLQPHTRLGRTLRALPSPQITVNYLGHAPTPAASGSGPLRPSSAPTGPTIGPANVLPTALDLTAARGPDGTLRLRVSADPHALPADTAATVADRISRELEAASRVVPLSPAPSLQGTRTLYLVHPVGGTIDWYLPLAHALAPYWDCYGLPHDTTGLGEARPPTVPELAAAYLDRIRAYQPAGAVTVAGWSFGAAVAYEIGRHAHGAGTPVAGLFLLDPPAPYADRPSPDVLAEHLHTLWPTRTRQALADALHATADLLPHARATALTSLLGVPDGPVDRLLSLLVNHATLTGWEPAEPLPGVQLILPADAADPAASAAAWRAHWPDERAITVVPGHHLTMLATAGGVEQVAAAITATTSAGVSSGDLSGAWASARVWG